MELSSHSKRLAVIAIFLDLDLLVIAEMMIMVHFTRVHWLCVTPLKVNGKTHA